MKIWDSLCETLLATSTRRGAMMGTLRCDHPDIEAFVSAKHDQTALNNFNLSVLVSDDFMRAVAENAQWQLVFPADGSADESRESDAGHQIHRRLPARELWQQIVTAAHASAEPGVLFIDTINRNNNLYYCETISATNPCGEIPLPPYGACDLGSINLTVLARNPFTEHADFDWQRLRDTVGVAVRFLDNVIDVSRFPLDAQARKAHDTRRIGLGVTGLADLLAMLGLGYDSEQGRRLAAEIMETVRDTAYAASVAIAKEKGAFPLFDQEKYLSAPFIERLPERLRAEIAKHGIRNSHLLAIAPAATISLLAGNVSSGVEPIYSLDATREVHDPELGRRSFEVRDYAYARWRALTGQKSSVPDVFVTADELPPGAHLAMQACLQPYVDNAISKTVNLAADASVDDVAALFSKAYSSGLKGCTVFRSGSRSGQVLRSRDAAHCCDIDREAD